VRPSTRGTRSALRVCSRFYPVRRKAYLIVEGEVLWWGCFYAEMFAILLSLAFAVIVTIVGGDYIVGQLRQAYPGANEPLLVLMGWDWWYLLVILCLFGAAPVAFLLCIDQFSTKKLALRLKEE